MFMTEVKTTWRTFHSEQKFLFLDQDGEDLVMRVIWYNSVMTAKRSQITEIVDTKVSGYQSKFLSSSVKISPRKTIYWKIRIWMFFPVRYQNLGNYAL